ncbi:uncharacterized protein A4U43_C02F15710 [Asparagus officinalis]|uniref:Peptidase A1 domain-containing protein n=1 Tax=Asparagus officinalis TaxID=4686 RepID=A0A5P1FKG8_ASPOF|nr:uncharacterized protein A4U43_C02F15710 [Asparagus officinalis]
MRLRWRDYKKKSEARKKDVNKLPYNYWVTLSKCIPRRLRGGMNASCATKVIGNSEELTDHFVKLGVQGLIGFGQGEGSLISQLASSGKVRKQFAHCLDNKDGGIFAIGRVVRPKVKLAPLYQGQEHFSMLYTILLESTEVDGQSLKEEEPRLTVIDSGATTVRFPRRINDFVEKQIFSKHPKLSKHRDRKNSTCFSYSFESLDKDFPTITLRFSNSLTLKAYPHDYVFPEDEENKKDSWCLAWIISKRRVAIGDLFLRDKLVVYDAENKLVGWKEYNCSSSIKVEDDTTGGVCNINAHNYTAPLS